MQTTGSVNNGFIEKLEINQENPPGLIKHVPTVRYAFEAIQKIILLFFEVNFFESPRERTVKNGNVLF